MAPASLGKSIPVLVNISFLLALSLVFFFAFYLSPPSAHGCEEEPASRADGDSPDPRGYIDYLHLFHCVFSNHSPVLGYAFLCLWLFVLFYLLANTASNYFCSSLESLSRVLGLSPAIAGITLLSLGNGAPDVFSSIVSFAAGGTQVGLSSVLGGAFFVSSAVLAIISICSRPAVSIDRVSFIRDLCFLLIALLFLLLILIAGQIPILAAVLFASLYIAYVMIVWMSQCFGRRLGEMGVPLLESVEAQQPPPEKKLDFSKKESCVPDQSWLLFIVELPLYLPRRLTIPLIAKERWSKPFAVASATLSPILLATLWISHTEEEIDSVQSVGVFFFAVLCGLVLGITAMEWTEDSHPPKRFQLAWLAGGFLMSVVWTYIIAGELVSLLISIGQILGVRASVLGVTVLAWGNSLGDLVANVAMAVNGGEEGAQIAVSGCYAGPIFNTLVGLGISFVMSSVRAYPSPFVIASKDCSEFVLILFLIVGLLWALAVMPLKGMKLNRVLGVGLLGIYASFLCFRVLQSLEILHLDF